MQQAAVRWSVTVSKETDLSLRAFLGSQGRKKGNLSKFIEEAVNWRVFHETLRDIKSRNTDISPDELQELIDETVAEVRAERYAKLPASQG